MKKKLLTLSLMFVFMFIININKVEGYTCEYGIKENDKAKWKHKVTLEVLGPNTIDFNISSPIYSYIEDTDGTPNVGKDNPDSTLRYRYTILSPCVGDTFAETWDNYLDGNCTDEPDNYYIYAELFPTEDAYNKANGKCPEVINYEFTRKSGDGDAYTMSLYVDDLAKQNIVYDDSDNQKQSSEVALAFDFSETEGIMISKEASTKPLNEVIDVYGCYTYSIYYKAMVEAKNANGDNCDGSREFTDNYTELQDLCTAYRSSESYVKVSGDNVSISSGCQKACTNLKDDVAKLCGFKNDGYCGSLSSKVVTYIFKLFGIVRYIIPALLVILSVLEYIKAVASDSEDEMKKVSGRFVKRLLAAALIILIPLVIDFILGLFDIPGLSATEPFCNK